MLICFSTGVHGGIARILVVINRGGSCDGVAGGLADTVGTIAAALFVLVTVRMYHRNLGSMARRLKLC